MKRLLQLARDYAVTFFICVALFAAFAGVLIGACIVGVIYAVFGGE